MRSEPEIAASIRDLTHDGRGVADIDGRRIFVPGALPTEQVVIRPRRRRRRFEEADLVSVVAPSASRVAAGCEYFGRCGGCAVQHLEYSAQVRFKEGVVADAFERIAGCAPERWLPAVESPQWGYRRRARLGVKFVPGKERVLVGFRERAAPYITDMQCCPVLVAPMNETLGELADVIGQTSIKSRLPQVEVAIGDERGAIVLRVLDPPTADDRARLEAFGRRHGLDVYLQPGGPGTAAPIADDSGSLSYALEDFGLRLEFAPTDFVQINAEINARIVAAVIEFARAGKHARVLDLFCGIGNFSLPLAQLAERVLGVEGEAGLVARAVRNAERNGIDNADFVTADLTVGGSAFLREQWDLVMLDPPRTGAEVVVSELLRGRPARIVYVSCHPATLARDAKMLVDAGYRLTAVGTFDMFPHTHHIEAMALFERERD